MPVDVLVVEDNRADVVMLTEALRCAGLDYRVRLADDGEEALELLDRLDFDAPGAPGLIILDLNLPRLDGAALLRTLRGRPELSRVPVVILTTSAWADEAVRLEDHPRRAFFQKPSFLEDWVAVARAIESYRAGELDRHRASGAASGGSQPAS